MRIPAGKNERKQYQQSKFKKGFITCSLCGKYEDWKCRITEDEGLALCLITPSSKKDRKGRYIHRLKTNSERNLVTNLQPVIENKEENLKADADRLNEVYSAFLGKLELSVEHESDLYLKRKLSSETVQPPFVIPIEWRVIDCFPSLI